MVSRTVYARIVSLLGACVLCTIFVAGLWPFHAPKNKVTWLQDKNGLAFRHFGSVVSSGAFRKGLNGSSEGSLEVWLEPQAFGSKHTILSFDSSDHPGVPFSLHQDKDALVVHRHSIDDRGTPRITWVVVNGVFRKDKPVFVTITMGEHDTSVYVDGVLARVSPIAGASSRNLTGRMILANSPGVNDNWSGVIRGLAIYQYQLNPVQVAQHYRSWNANLQPTLMQAELPVALYKFNDGRGTLVRNETDPSNSLSIPARYFVVHQEFLASPRREYRPTWSYWEDIAVNIAGFIPLGAWAFLYYSSVRHLKLAAMLAVFTGFSVSLTIEIVQAFLPTRSSGMTDVITNTLGVVIGIVFCRWSLNQRWFCKARQNGRRAGDSRASDRRSEAVFSAANCTSIT